MTKSIAEQDRIEAGPEASLAAADFADLRPNAVALLTYLMARKGEVVAKDDLMDAVWPDTHVSENSLYQAVSDLRRALKDHPELDLQTVPRRGYRLIQVDASQVSAVLGRGRGAAVLGGVLALVLVLAGVGAWLWNAGGAARQQAAERPSIRVEAFRNDSAEAAWDSLGRAMADEIGRRLTAARWLQVIEGEKVARYRLAGSYLATENRLSVQARLIENESGALVWSRSWDGVQSAFFDLQAQVAHDAAAELGGHWSGAVVRFDASQAVRRPTERLDAYALFLRGTQAKHRFTPESFEEARQLLARAVEIDPAFVDAWTTLSVVHNLRALVEPDRERLEDIVTARQEVVETAITLAREDPNVLMEQAWLLSRRGDYVAAREAVRRAVALAPDNPDVLAYAALNGNLRVDLGAEGVAWTDKALDLNPDPPPWYFIGAGLARFTARDWQGALEALDRAPDYITRDVYSAVALAQMGRRAEAEAAAARLSERYPGFRITHYVYQEGMEMPVNGRLLIDTAIALGLPPGDFFSPRANAAASSGQRP